MPLPGAGILNAMGASAAMVVLVALYLFAKPEDKRDMVGAIALYSVIVTVLIMVVFL